MRTPRQMPCNRPGSQLPKLLGLILISMPMASCATLGTVTTRYLDTSCAAFSPLTYSSTKDSAATVTEIRSFNRAYDALCPAQ